MPKLNVTLSDWEARATGELPPAVRRNMRIDLLSATLFGPFVAGLSFLPVVMRKLGASPEWLAFYSAQAFIGFLFTSLSVLVMPRRRGLQRFAAAIWVLSRGSFLLVAWVTNAHSLILLMLWFWIVEGFPVPVYTRLMQAIYPARSRGRVMSLIRVGLSLANLAVTPLIGWLLDTVGYQALYPITGLFAVAATLLFGQLRYVEEDLAESAPPSGARLGRLAVTDRRFALYLGAITLFGIGLLSGSALQPLVQVDRLKLSYADLGLLNVVQSAFFLLGYVIWGRLIDRRGAVWAMRFVFLAAAVIPATYLAASAGWMLAPAFAALGLVNAGLDLGTLNVVLQLAPPDRAGEYSAIQTTVLGARGLVAPFIGVWLAQGLGLAFPVVFGLGLVLIVAAVGLLLKLGAGPAPA